MNKKLIHLIILFIISIDSFGQVKSIKTNNVYELVLTRFVETALTKYPCLIKNDTLIISCDRYIFSKLPTKIKGINIAYVGFQTKIPIRNNDSAFMVFMSPILTLYNNKLGIEFSLEKDYITEGGEISSVICSGAGGNATIIYDCKKQKYIIENFDFTLSDCECNK